MPSIDARITKQFREWARRGQGFAAWDAPVSPEPAFLPFRGYDLSSHEVIDDGLRPTLISSLIRQLSGSPSREATEDDTPPQPRRLEGSERVELQLLVPKDQRFQRDEYLYFFSSLAACREPLSFELLSSNAGITVLVAAHPGDVSLIRQQLAAFFPACVVIVADRLTQTAWESAVGEYFGVAEFGLREEFMRPLRSAKMDGYIGLAGALSTLVDREFCLLQIIFERVRHPWSEHMLRTVSVAGDRPLFVNAPEIYEGAKQKASLPLYAAVVRVVARSGTEERIGDIIDAVAGSLTAHESIDGNGLVPVAVEDYPPELRLEDALARRSRRSGMILNADELVSLVHLPSADVRSPKLLRLGLTTRRAPEIVAHGKGPLIGQNTHAGVTVPVSLSPDQRLRHIHIIGASGTGKSTLLFNLIQHDIDTGGGVAVLDPHGDLVDRILGVIPPERIKDVVLLDPSDTEYPVGFNILHAHSELEKTLLASDLVSVFQRLSASWGDQMGSVLSHAVLAFLESDKGGSLLDLRRFLLEPAFRNSYLESVRDPEVVYYWRHGFSQLTGNKSIGPILTRLETFLTPKSIRYMVAQRENRLDFADILDTGKIFLAKLSQGAIGRENSHLLGTLLVSKFQQLAMARQAQAERNRRDFFLYVDEFPNFITPSMAEILAGARKYRLGLILGHQELRQLERDREVSSAVMGNAYTRICFRVGDSDARTLESGFSHFGSKDLQNLGTGEAICRVERSDYDFNLKVPLPTDPDEGDAAERCREVIEASRRTYGRPRADVEATLCPAREAPAIVPQQEFEPAPVLLPKRGQPTPAPIRPVVPPVFPPTPSTPGRGGKEHKYLQTFIKQWAEGMGWRTAIEAPVPGGAGSVDVLLSKGGVTIACEISVTTSIEHEIRNLEKCVRGGFSHIVSVCADEKRAHEIEAEAKQSMGEGLFPHMRFFTPPQLFSFVGELDAKSATTDTTVKGYRVKVSYRPVDRAQHAERMASVTGVIAKSLKRLQGKDGPKPTS